MRVSLSVSIALCFLLLPGLASANQPPVADAGGDQSAFTDEGIALYGSASDPDGDPIIAWKWSLDSQPAGSYASLSPTWSATTGFFADTAGDYIVSFMVFDETDWSLPDTATITVVDDQPPVAVVTANVVTGWPSPWLATSNWNVWLAKAEAYGTGAEGE